MSYKGTLVSGREGVDKKIGEMVASRFFYFCKWVGGGGIKLFFFQILPVCCLLKTKTDTFILHDL